MSRNPLTFQLPRGVLYVLFALLLAPWALVIFLLLRSGPATSATNPWPIPSPITDTKTYQCRPGPWGEVQYTRILIEPPEDMITNNYGNEPAPRWIFVGYKEEKLGALWTAAQLSDKQRAAINDRAHWQVTPQGITISPTTEFILGLSPASRAKIYTALAAFTENPAQYEPYRFRADSSEEWFADSDLDPQTIAAVKKLLYRRGTSLLFSDQQVVLPTIPSLDERTQLLKTLARQSTLLVKLRVRSTSNVDALAAYWGRGPRSKDLRPLLQSLRREGNGTLIDITHMLPQLARSLLYTYPSPNAAGVRSYIDCHWTALNFFNSQPDPAFNSIENVSKAFHDNYYTTTGKLTFGDILMFVKRDGTVIHSCVYIADDIVYTKNGADPDSPWILMTLPDVKAFYPSEDPIDIQHYRAKAIPVSEGSFN